MKDLDDIAGGDEQRGQALRDALAELGHSGNPVLREMAAAIQNGGLSLREAVETTAYGDELAGPFRTFWTMHQEKTSGERDDLAARDQA